VPTALLRKGNSDLARHGIFVWSIPALTATSTLTGHTVRTCPNAGICAALCYARRGRYRFSNVLESHTRNLDAYLASPHAWRDALALELKARRFRPTGTPHSLDWPVRPDLAWWVEQGGRAVRIHDAGDFFDPAYLDAWLEVAAATPDVLFYAYTKQVSWVKAAKVPANFVAIFSMGGKEDSLIDPTADRHDDIFPSLEALEAAGYIDQAASDLMAPLLPTTRIGIVANNIPALRRMQGGSSFAEIQQLGWNRTPMELRLGSVP